MKLIVRTLLLLFVLSFAGATFAQSTAKPAKAPKTAKVSKRKASKAATATPAAPATAAEAAAAGKPAPALAPVPAAAPTAPTLIANPDRTMTDGVSAPAPATPELAPGMVIDPITGQAVPEKLTTIQFEEVAFDFGKIDQGDVVKHKFKFTNTGENPLILENVKPSCGCTALDWPKDPIAPGKSGEIEAQFNSAGKVGPQMKNITITLNSVERLERLSFTGEVIAKPVEGGTTPTPEGGH